MSRLEHNSSGFVRTAEITRRSRQARRELSAITGPRIVKLSVLFNRVSYLPYLLENVYVEGYEHFPPADEPAPLLAGSHKKIHDVFSYAELLMGRPLSHFHLHTAVAQGGLFSGILPYRDFTPAILKRRPFRRPAIILARFLGKRIGRIFSDALAYPAYREGSDLPSAETYRHHHFAGPEITGMSYDAFVKFANRSTIHSIQNILRDIEELNRMLVILPEGGYRNNGRVSEIQGLLGLIAFRKQRETLFISVSYDSLCPDRLRRINAFFHIHPPVAPPADRNSITPFLETARETLQKNTPILASHLLALALRPFLNGGTFRLPEFEGRFRTLARRALDSGFPADPALADPAYLESRLDRFYRHYRRRWLNRERDLYSLRLNRVELYKGSEQTVPHLEWLLNNIAHFIEPDTQG